MVNIFDVRDISHTSLSCVVGSEYGHMRAPSFLNSYEAGLRSSVDSVSKSQQQMPVAIKDGVTGITEQ